VHELAPSDPEKVLPGQGEHDADPIAAKLPLVHLTQVALVSAPKAPLADPAGQRTQSPTLSYRLNLPAPQRSQLKIVVSPSANRFVKPARHLHCV